MLLRSSVHPCCLTSLLASRFHCHNLVHEDNDMLRAFDMVGGKEVDTNSAHKEAWNKAHTLGINTAAGSQ